MPRKGLRDVQKAMVSRKIKCPQETSQFDKVECVVISPFYLPSGINEFRFDNFL